MRILIITAYAFILLISMSCKYQMNNKNNMTNMSSVTKETIDSTIILLTKKYGTDNSDRITKGVNQSAALWNKNDGKNKDFREFCLANFAADSKDIEVLFERLSTNFEILFGNFNKISVDLKKPLHLDEGEMLPIDELFGAWEPSAHFSSDFFENKIAFITVLNFPFYTLKEKTELGNSWDRKQWAYARLGDIFASRIPAEILLKISESATNADTYISEYNIYVGHLLDESGKTYFPADMKLISHWGLRDELKACYSEKSGLIKQKMIFEVMKRIINQDIPDSVINNPEYDWNPYSNKVYKNGKEIKMSHETDTRYSYLLQNFQSLKEADAYCPHYPTYISRKFEQELEIPQEEVEKLFIEFVSSPQVKKVATLISKRLNRKLQPFDIWYDGFKPRSSVKQEDLDKLVMTKYPDKASFEKDLPEILKKLQFTTDQAEYICSKIAVDPSRGAGHAWGAMMKSDKAHLRTRFENGVMKYKGYNIAMHEFGHTVEQTLTLYDIDYYILNGVPNTAFTEALAFIFQKRDLDILGMKNNDSDKEYYMTLDNFWSCYEIMGVSIVDMRVWKWMYEHPDATPGELKEAVISISKEVWNSYYADVFGIKDQEILAIYSHMIDAPLYLSAYPLGHLIEFQIENQLRDKIFAKEVSRMFKNGRIIPELWMQQAVGTGLTADPILKATDDALNEVEKNDTPE